MQVSIASDKKTATLPDGSTLFRTRKKYWADVRLNGARSGSAGAYIYTIPASVVRAFGYAQGADMAAGGRAGVTATAAHTNIEQARRTNGDDLVVAYGLGIELLPRSDLDLARVAYDRLTVAIERAAGGDREPIGGVGMYPAGFGLAGLAETKTGHVPLGGGRPLIGAGQNGVPATSNRNMFAEPLLWSSAGKGESSLAIAIEAVEAIALATDQAADTAGSGIHGYTQPADGAVFLDFRVHLIGDVYSAVGA